MLLDDGSLPPEGLLALLQADAVDDALALGALDTRLDDVELAAVNHEGDAADLGVANTEVDKLGHGRQAINEAIIHIDVQNVSSLLDLCYHKRERKGLY